MQTYASGGELINRTNPNPREPSTKLACASQDRQMQELSAMTLELQQTVRVLAAFPGRGSCDLAIGVWFM